MSLDQSTWGLQNAYTDLDNCAQPKLIHISLNEPTPIGISVRYQLDFTQYFEQNKIDFIQGVVARIYSVNNPTPNSQDQISSPLSEYSVQLLLSNGYKTSLNSTQFLSNGFGSEHHRPLPMDRSTKIELYCLASNNSFTGGINMDLYFTNYRVRPYDVIIPQINFF